MPSTMSIAHYTSKKYITNITFKKYIATSHSKVTLHIKHLKVHFTNIPSQPGEPIRISWKGSFSSSSGENKVPSSWEDTMDPSTTTKPVRVFYGTTPTKASAVVRYKLLAYSHPNYVNSGWSGVSASIGSKHTITDLHNTKTLQSHNSETIHLQ